MRVGAIELQLLEHITACGPISVRAAAESFGEAHQVGITTVQQMMERLRKKGLLSRDNTSGIWLYQACNPREKVLKGVVKDFIDRTLGGSLEPFTLYLADAHNVSDDDLARLRALVDQLESQKENRQ